MWLGVPTVPIMVMGATDGRYLRAQGIPCYGVQGFFMDRDDVRFHGRDERLGVQSFYEGQAFLYELAKRLSTTRAGRVLDQRNSFKALHGAGNRGGFHAFRRFRFAVLRRGGVPENLIKLWLGHPQNLMDLYAAQLRYDVVYRREWCEKAGLGFELGELGYKLEVPIRPLLVA
jgi:hypothetical protein